MSQCQKVTHIFDKNNPIHSSHYEKIISDKKWKIIIYLKLKSLGRKGKIDKEQFHIHICYIWHNS